MKIFVTILAIACLALIGFMAYVISMPEVIPPTPKPPARKGGGTDAKSAISEPITEGVNLSAERQLELWDCEATAFQLETQLETLLANWLNKSRRDELLKFVQDDAKISVLSSDTWSETRHGQFVRRVRSTDQKENADADGLVDSLLAHRALIDGSVEMELRVLEIQGTAEDTWQCRLDIVFTGTTAEDHPITAGSQHAATLRFRNRSRLETNSIIEAWSIEQQSVVENEQPLAEEITNVAESLLLNSLDNWKASSKDDPQPIVPHRFQIAAADFDNDGDDDLAMVSGDGKRVVLTNDNQVFHFATISLGIQQEIPTSSSPPPVLWFDADNDGDLDLLCGMELFRNDGEQFSNITESCGIDFGRDPTAVIPADFDCDGQIDLYVTHRGFNATEGLSWIDGEEGAENQLYRSLGDGQFENVTAKANAGGGVKASSGGAWFFANDDRYPDLVVANERSEATLLINNGDGTFKDVSSPGWTSRSTGFTGGVTVGDMNNDGRSDLYFSGLGSWRGQRVTAFLKQSDYDQPDLLERITDLASGNRLLRQTAEGTFENVTDQLQAGTTGWGFGAAIFDIDNDGWQDVYATSGFRSVNKFKPGVDSSRWRRIATVPTDTKFDLPRIGRVDDDRDELWSENLETTSKMRYNVASFQPNRLFINNNGEDFIDVSSVSELGITSDSRSVIPVDLNQDRAVDLLIGSAGGGPVKGFVNLINKNHSVKIKLVGTDSNRFGVGSRVTATIGDRTIVRDMFPGSGFMANGPSVIWIGTGEAKVIDKLSIRWPTGETQTHENILVDQIVSIIEGKTDLETAPFSTTASEKDAK